MDKTGSTSMLAPKTVNRQFFQWAVKWFYANHSENTSTKPDIPSIICLLQAIGFKLREFEKGDQLIPTNEMLKNDNVRITMECGTSKMVAILEMDDVSCECPGINDAKDGSFWSITGTGPMASIDNLNKIEETGSNLLPYVSKETSAVVRDVTYRLFKMINNNCDINQNMDSNMNIPDLCANNTIIKSTDSKEGLVRSFTDIFDHNFKSRTVPYFTSNLANSKSGSSRSVIKGNSVAASKKPKLNRQGTYEIDEDESIDEPRPSPPKIASSPVLHQLCTSLGQLSMQSDEELLGLADYVVKAHQILDKAVNFIIKKLPLSSSNSSIPEEAHFVKPIAPPIMSSSFCVSSPRSSVSSVANQSICSGSSSRPGSSCSMPGRMTQSTASRLIPSAHKPLARRSVAGTTNNTTSNLPPMRDRASSLSVTQRPSHLQSSPVKKGVGGVAARKRSTIGGVSGIAQRTAPATSRLPASKLSLPKSTSSNLSTTLGNRTQGSSSTATQQRANLSFIKTPSTTSRLSSAAGSSSGNTSLPKFVKK